MSHRVPGPPSKLRLLKTRRGWVVGALAAVACTGGTTLAASATAGDVGPACDATATATAPDTAPAEAPTDPEGACAGGTTPDTIPTVPPAATSTLAAPTTITVARPAPAPPPATAPPATPPPVAEPVPETQAAQSTSSSEKGAPAHARRHRHARGRVEIAKRHAHARHHRHAKRHKRHPTVREQQYFPPVSVDWTLLTPLAPPPLPGLAAKTFPGPLFLLPIYEAAATKYNVPWQVLASINEVESNWGHNQGPSSAGAIGWMQFMPSTWKRWGIDANGDGIKNPHDPVDAIFSAARYLHAAHADDDLGHAIYAYNHANWYVDDVVHRAIELGSIPEDLLAALVEKGRHQAKAIHRVAGSRGLFDRHARVFSLGQAMLLGDRRLRRLVLDTQSIRIYRCGREDIAGDVVDRRVLEVLRYLVGHGLKPTVTSLRCGHGVYTSSGNVSEHSSGDAVDISAINGIPILGHQGKGSITELTIRALLKLGGAMKPHQIISLMTFDGATNTLALPDHADHIHIGFRPMRKIATL